MVNRWADNFRGWFKPKPPAGPVTPAAPPTTPQPGPIKAVNWARAWQILRTTDFRTLWRAIPIWLVLLILAVTGLFTWIVGILALILRLINIVVR